MSDADIVPPPTVKDVPWSAGQALIAFLVAWIGAPIVFLIGLRGFKSVAWVHNFLQAFNKGDITASFIFALANAAAAAAIVGYYIRKHHVNLRSLGLRQFNIVKTVLYIVAAFIGFALLVAGAYALISWLFPQFNAAQEQTNEFTKAATDPNTRRLSFIALVLIPPIIEETVFRGFIFPAFSKRFGVWFGALTSSLLFGLAHLQYNVGVYTVLLGLLLCFMYIKLRSIVPGIILHMLNNYLAFIALSSK